MRDRDVRETVALAEAKAQTLEEVFADPAKKERSMTALWLCRWLAVRRIPTPISTCLGSRIIFPIPISPSGTSRESCRGHLTRIPTIERRGQVPCHTCHKLNPRSNRLLSLAPGESHRNENHGNL